MREKNSYTLFILAKINTNACSILIEQKPKEKPLRVIFEEDDNILTVKILIRESLEKAHNYPVRKIVLTSCFLTKGYAQFRRLQRHLSLLGEAGFLKHQ